MALAADLCDIGTHRTRRIETGRPMNDVTPAPALTQREVLLHALYEASELEHNLMCTYLYAAASLKDGEREGLRAEEAAAVRRWRQVLMGVAIEEMGHLAAVWNITSGLGGAPRFGRSNFPLDPGLLPASVVVKLAPFNADTLQHFVFLERPRGSTEPDRAGFASERNPAFAPAFPAATNPVLRRPPRPEGRVWLENPDAVATVDLANACYGLMLRLLAYAYAVRGPSAEKSLAVDLAIGLMQAVMPLAERAARLPAGPSNPQCNAGLSFITLRDSAALPPGPAARRVFVERFAQLAEGAAALRAGGDARAVAAADQLASLASRAQQGFDLTPAAASAAARAQGIATGAAPEATAGAAAGAETAAASGAAPASTVSGGVETVQGERLELAFEARRCIHSRFCVTGAPKVFLANVKGPWIHPDAMPVERLVEVAHACPSGAIRYRRKDGAPEEPVPPVNLASVREGGPYAFRAQLQIDGAAAGFRATLCRCGASKNKPYCDGSHHEIGFTATGEPPSGKTDVLPVRDGVRAIDPQANGPLKVRGNLEIMSGTGRVVARVTSTYLCRCGGSANKPFCDGTHAKIGFKSG